MEDLFLHARHNEEYKSRPLQLILQNVQESLNHDQISLVTFYVCISKANFLPRYISLNFFIVYINAIFPFANSAGVKVFKSDKLPLRPSDNHGK